MLLHGGGVLIVVQDHLLIDTVSCDHWCRSKVAKIIAVETKEWVVVGGYTQKHGTAPELFSAFEQMRASGRFEGKQMILFMDANCHHAKWLGSKSTDNSGRVAKAFTENEGMNQYIHFPTRGDNTLDLVISDVQVETMPLPHLGSSDHIAVRCEFDVRDSLPEPPPLRQVYHWKSAPWGRIRGLECW